MRCPSPNGAGLSFRRKRLQRKRSGRMKAVTPRPDPWPVKSRLAKCRSKRKTARFAHLACSSHPPIRAVTASDHRCGGRDSGRPRSCSWSTLIAEIDERRRVGRFLRDQAPEVPFCLARPCESTGERRSAGSWLAAAKLRDQWRVRLGTSRKRRSSRALVDGSHPGPFRRVTFDEGRVVQSLVPMLGLRRKLAGTTRRDRG